MMRMMRMKTNTKKKKSIITMVQYASLMTVLAVSGVTFVLSSLVTTASAAAATTIVPDYPYTRIDGGKDWEESRWYVQNDGVMGGKSKGDIQFIDTMLQFSGNIVTQGGGFTSVRRRANLDLRQYAGIVVTVEAAPYTYSGTGTATTTPTGLHLQLDDSSYYAYSSAFTIPLATITSTVATTVTSVYLPMESFDRGTRMGYSCRNGCVLNQAAIDQMSLYMLFQEGPFDIRVLSINAVEEPVAFPSPPVGFTSDEEVIALLQSTIET